MRISTLLSSAALVALLASCGYSTSDRALSGGGLGAGVGMLGAAVTGGSIGEGALIGGAVGAAGGALTNSNQVDLGKPLWR